jgi:ribosomal protein S18 acetylase RimI-like enzyme
MLVRVTTTNDNLNALRFYQRRGFRIMGVHPGAVNEARRLKPSIPAIGAYGIPICDEIDLERKRLTNYRFDGVARFRLFVP